MADAGEAASEEKDSEELECECDGCCEAISAMREELAAARRSEVTELRCMLDLKSTQDRLVRQQAQLTSEQAALTTTRQWWRRTWRH